MPDAINTLDLPVSAVFVHKLQKYQNTNVLFLESIYYLHGINLLSLERSLAVHEQGPRLASLHN